VKRIRTQPRPNWQSIVGSQGLVYGTPARDAAGADRPYWDESVYYEFDMDEVLALEADAELVHSMCMQAVEQVVLMERYADFGLPEWSWQHIAESWHRSDPHVYGRFDLRYDARSPAKLLEYNADTPTTLLEAAIVQWYWLKDRFPDSDQWNSLHEQLVDRWKGVRDLLPSNELHFSWSGVEQTGEDQITTTYMQETAAEAGFETVALTIEDVGWDSALERFVDLEEAPIHAMFKLYPWEWVLDDAFGKNVASSLPQTMWISPCCGRCTPATRTCCPPTSTTRMSSPNTSASPSWAEKARTSPSSVPAWRPPRAVSTARKVSSTNCWTLCPNSTTCGPRWGRGLSAIRPPGSVSARAPGW